MTNEMKLLRAFIEASGYDIEKFIDRTEVPISKQSGLNRIAIHAVSFGGKVMDLVTDSSGAFKRGDDECYYLKPSLNVDYKITKKRKKCELIDMYLFTYCEINKDQFIGGSMGIFEIETTNPKNLYVDVDNNIPHLNPVIADSKGRFPKIYIEKPYKVVIHDQHGVNRFEDSYK